MTNGTRDVPSPRKVDRRRVALVRRGHLQVEQPGQRQVDLLDLVEVDRLTEPPQPRQVVVGEGERCGVAQPAPRRPAPRRSRATRRTPVARPAGSPWADTLSPMCGIVGYVGEQSALDVVIDGLRRLEYRGYDSAGVAMLADGKLATEKRAGKLANLEAALAETRSPRPTTGIGHTRWATHGAPNDRNAHPHLDCTGSVAVIHNGIIENFAALRAELEARGPPARVRDRHRGRRAPARGGDPRPGRHRRPRRGDAAVCRRLEGAFTLVATHVDAPDVVVGARRNSPLVVGRGDGENFLASDVAAFIAHTRDAVELGQDQVVELRRDGVNVTDFDGNPGEVHEYHVDWDLSAAEKGGYDYFMLKEIDEQPQAVADTMLGRLTDDGRLHLDEMRLSDDDLREVDKIIVIACGTSFHAGLVAKYAIEHWTPHPVRGRAGVGVPLPRPGPHPVDARRRDLAVGRDDGHPDGAAARPRAARPGALRSATPTARRCRASPTPCSTRTPVRRSRSPRPRATSPRSSRASSSRSTSPRCAARSTATRSRRGRATCVPCRTRSQTVLARVEPVRALARELRGRDVGALPRPPRRLPDRSRGRAQAQGARLHARRGLRGR